MKFDLWVVDTELDLIYKTKSGVNRRFAYDVARQWSKSFHKSVIVVWPHGLETPSWLTSFSSEKREESLFRL